MPKFSDSPYFLLKDYIKGVAEPYDIPEVEDKNYLLWDGVIFSDENDEYKDRTSINDSSSGSTWEPGLGAVRWNAWYNKLTHQMFNSYFKRPNDIIVNGGDFIELYIKDPSYGYRPIRLIPTFEDPIEKIYFRFTDYELKRSVFSEDLNDYNNIYGEEWECDISDYKDYISCPGSGFTYYFKDWDSEDVKMTEISNHIGQEVYFRKDSPFYEWLKESAYSFYLDKWEHEFNIRNFVNTDKNFLYFGQIYPSRLSNDDSGEEKYHIIFEGMKDFINKSIPYHQRTPRMLEYLEIYFDRIYHEIYHLQKDIFSLYDSFEIDKKYLHYILSRYNVNLDKNVLKTKEQREFARDIIYLLKRKGTYSCFQIIWKIVSGTINTMDILEKWHDKDLIGKIPEEEYVNIPYTDFYTKEVNIDNLELSTAYRLEFSLDKEPMTALEIEPSYLCNSLYNYYELFRPVNRVSNYAFIISPITDFTGEWISLYEGSDYHKHLLTRYTMTTNYIDDGYIHLQKEPSDSWTIFHGLNSNDILVQVIDFDLLKITPSQIIYDNNSIDIKFNHPVSGAVLIKKAEWFKTNIEKQENWIVKHDLDNKEVLVQIKDKKFESSSITNLNNTIRYVDKNNWLYDGSMYYQDISHDTNHRYPFITIWNLETNMIENMIDIISIDYNTVRVESSYTFDLKAIFYEDKSFDENVSISDSDWLNNGDSYYKIIKHNFNSRYISCAVWNSDTNIFLNKLISITNVNSDTLIISSSHPMNVNILLCRYRSSQIISDWIEDSGSYYKIVNHNQGIDHPIITCWDIISQQMEIQDIEYIDTNTLKVYSETGNTIRLNINFILKDDLKSTEEKIYTDNIQLTDVNEILVKGHLHNTIMIANPDYVIYFMTEPMDIWEVNHNLNKRGIMAQFYDDDNNKIHPVEYEILNNNNIRAKFSEEIMGYIIFKNIGHYFLNNSFVPDEYGDFDLEFKAGSIENSMLEDGIVFTKDINSVYMENDIYYVPINIPIGDEFNIREMGIFEKSTGDLIIYTKCYEIYKHKNFDINITYRISKNPLN